VGFFLSKFRENDSGREYQSGDIILVIAGQMRRWQKTYFSKQFTVASRFLCNGELIGRPILENLLRVMSFSPSHVNPSLVHLAYLAHNLVLIWMVLDSVG
jgi:hypothetical protein